MARFIPDLRFRNVLLFTVAFAFAVQIIIVTYNSITGFILVETMAEYLFRVVYASGISAILGLMLIFPDLFLISWLNNKYRWDKAPRNRVALQLALTLVFASTVSTVGTLIVNFIHEYTDNLPRILITNALITSVINIMLMMILEAWLFSREGKRERLKAEKLENELAVIRFEVLKNQINPHFLFNSLNALSHLIDQDTRKAQVFIEAFAQIYHYVLETIEKPVVTLEEELGFARSYMYLQQIRHGDHVKFTVDLSSADLPLLLPPLSLQVALENALKHNVTGASHPLEVRMLRKSGCLEIRNTIRAKTSSVISTGLGQKNLAKRYAMISNLIPEFRVENEEYVVKLPLIPCED